MKCKTVTHGEDILRHDLDVLRHDLGLLRYDLDRLRYQCKVAVPKRKLERKTITHDPEYMDNSTEAKETGHGQKQDD